jgi:RNA polymerase sigma factor (sigma-70 family)
MMVIKPINPRVDGNAPDLSPRQRAEQFVTWALKLARIQSERRQFDIELARSAALLGLVKAAKRYDPKWNIPFSSYSARYIKWQIAEEFRLERRERAATGFDDMVDLEGLACDPRENTREFESAHDLDFLINLIPSDEQRTLVRLMYAGGMTMRKACREMGISESWAVILHRRAIEYLREKLGSQHKSSNKNLEQPLTYRGRTQTLRQWSQELGLKHRAVQQRLERGWDVERALSTPSPGKPAERCLTWVGRTQSIVEWSRETGIPRATIVARLHHPDQWTIEQILTTPHLGRGPKRKYMRKIQEAS